MAVVIGCDHAGLELKLEVIALLEEMGVDYLDSGTDSLQSVDYPDFGERVSDAVSSGKVEKGILICGTGIGMSIVANKHNGVRAAACETIEAADLSRKHNDANILCLGERLTTWDEAQAIVRVFLKTDFEGGRHERRVAKIHTLTSC